MTSSDPPKAKVSASSSTSTILTQSSSAIASRRRTIKGFRIDQINTEGEEGRNQLSEIFQKEMEIKELEKEEAQLKVDQEKQTLLTLQTIKHGVKHTH